MTWALEGFVVGIIVVLGIGGVLMATLRQESRDFRAEVYRDAGSDWRWRVLARNNRIVADSAEGYRNFAHARRMVRRVCRVGRRVKVLSREN